jgi:hypothetical protein
VTRTAASKRRKRQAAKGDVVPHLTDLETLRPRHGCLPRFETADVRARWALAQTAFKLVDRLESSFGVRLYSAIAEIADPAGHARVARGALSEIPESHALNAA